MTGRARVEAGGDRQVSAGSVAGRPPMAVRGRIAALSGVDVNVHRAPVLRGLDLAIRAGEAVGLVGPNGSGKTTLLLVLATLLRPVAGSGHVLGADLVRRDGGRSLAKVRPSIALVGHTPAMYEQLSLLENLRFVAGMTGRPDREVDAALAAAGLAAAAGRRVSACSHGMVRRAELARVLLTRPRLLLLDEAHAGLDQSSSALVGLVVNGVREAGGAGVLVSHDPHRLHDLVDRVLELRDGVVVDAGRGGG